MQVRPVPFWALVVLATACSGGKSLRERPSKLNVLLVTLDTTRSDRLGCYGYARNTSPNLDRFANEATLYTRAVANSSWTLPSHASLFTAKLTTSHGAQYDAAGPLSLGSVIDAPADWREYRARPLADSETTLAELLQQAGYATGAVVGGPWMKRVFGLAQGFDYYDDDQIDSSGGRRADRITDAALRWLDRRATDKPFLLFLNYYDPHGPYDAPEPFGSAFLAPGTRLSPGVPKGDELQARYDAEIQFMDHHLGRVFERLRERQLLQQTLVVVTADHGELLGERGRIGHGETLTEPELRIPLLVRAPQRAAARSGASVQLTDVMPMILSQLGMTLPVWSQGGLPPRSGHPVVAEVYPLEAMSPHGHWRALYDGPLKYLWSNRRPPALFDLEQDPDEHKDLARERPDAAARLGRLLERYLASLPKPGDPGPPRALDRETQEALRSLGYVR